MSQRCQFNLTMLLLGGVCLAEALGDRVWYGGVLKAFEFWRVLLFFGVFTLAGNLLAAPREEGKTSRRGRIAVLLLEILLAAVLIAAFVREPAVRWRMDIYQMAALFLGQAAGWLLRRRPGGQVKWSVITAAAALLAVFPIYCLASGVVSVPGARKELSADFQQVEWKGNSIPVWLEEWHWQEGEGLQGELLLSYEEMSPAEQKLELYFFRGLQKGEEVGIFYLPFRGEIGAVYQVSLSPSLDPVLR